MKINIYQINQDRDTQRLKFMGLDAVRKVLQSAEPDCAAYDKVYSGNVKCRNLEDVFVLFQSGRPEGFQGHSLSVSDVVEVEDAASITPGFYFCDSIGFKEIPFRPELANDVVQSPTIQVVLVEPGKLARIAEVGTTLDAMQRTVGGDIEAYYPFEEQVCIVCNEEGKINGLPLNRAIRDEIPEILRILSPALSSSAIAAENPSAAFPRSSRSGIWKNTVSRNGSSVQETALNLCLISLKIGSVKCLFSKPQDNLRRNIFLIFLTFLFAVKSHYPQKGQHFLRLYYRIDSGLPQSFEYR